MVRSKKLRRMFRLLSVFLVIFLIEYGDFMGIEVQAEQKQETIQETPEQPEKEERLIGRIFVEYRKGRNKGGKQTFGGITAQKIPRLGYVEEEIPWVWILVFAGSTSLLMLCFVKQIWERKRKNGKK